MIKFLPLVLLIAVILGVFGYFGFSKQTPQKIVDLTQTPQVSYEDRIKILEGAVLELANKTGNTKIADSVIKSSPIPASNTDSRLNTLEISMSDLQTRVKKLEGGVVPISQTPKQSPVYILSLGSGGTTTAMDWTTVSNISIVVDPADYPGFSSMQLEAQIKVLSGNGKVFARLYETSSGLSVLSSEVSTSSENHTWVSSPTFTLSGKKTYVFQLKSLTGYEASIQSARIKVNF